MSLITAPLHTQVRIVGTDLEDRHASFASAGIVPSTGVRVLARYGGPVSRFVEVETEGGLIVTLPREVALSVTVAAS